MDSLASILATNKKLTKEMIGCLLEVKMEDLNTSLCDKNGNCVIDTKIKLLPIKITTDTDCYVIQFMAHSCSPYGKIKKFGPDDCTYNKYKLLFRILPRAKSCCVIVKNKKIAGIYHMQGMSKFMGQTADEEDDIVDNIGDSGLFQLPIDDKNDKRYVFTEKENGKMAVVTIFKYDENLYFYGGSKNDHIVVPINMCNFGEDIYQKKTFATEITDIFLKQFNNLLSERQKEMVVELLVGQNKVLCGEYNDGKHIVKLTRDKHIVYFGIVDKKYIIDTLCDDIIVSVEKMKELGLDSVKYQLTSDEREIMKLRKDARYEKNVEGYVIHHQQKNPLTNKWMTFSIEKYKTWWYVIIRMLREFIRSKNGLALGWEKRWVEKMQKRNEEYMKVSEKYLGDWLILTKKFIKWFTNKGYEQKQIGMMQEEIGMADFWFDFSKEQ